MKRFYINPDGTLEECSRFAVCHHVDAPTKKLAIEKLIKFAKAALEHTPQLKQKNGAWQLSYAVIDGFAVEAGTTERDASFCGAHVANLRDIKPETASFAYYASEEYRACKKVEVEQ